ncbi:MAG TPA: hypothetical protein VML91_10710 [Burkholderiales bacterium]|nr:hypothetical protein [Burkholderiales bacterium]
MVGIEDRHRVTVLHRDDPTLDLVVVLGVCEPGRGQRTRRDPMTNAIPPRIGAHRRNHARRGHVN